MEHPITPPPELVEQWRTSPEYVDKLSKLTLVSMTTIKLQEVATQAANWGADQRLEEIVHWLVTGPYGASIVVSAPDLIADLRAACNPKTPSLKEQALEALGPEPLPETTPAGDGFLNGGAIQRYHILLRAIKSLPDPQD